MEPNKYHFFYKSKLSQWHKVNFIVDGVKYNCCEQYMMARKAVLFNDMDSLNRIMNTPEPRDHQHIGRTVKNYVQSTWDTYKYGIVYTGNYHRFNQNKEDRDWLLATEGTLVECSPVDGVWGIKLGMDDPRIHDESKWRGQNLLGKALTQVRETLRKELENET